MCLNGDMSKLLSRIISRVLDPVVEIPLAVSLAVWFAVSGGLRWRFLVLILVVDAVLPFLFMLIALVKGQITSWDIRKREERIPLYLFTLFVHGIGVLLAHLLERGDLARILFIFWLVAAVFALITLKWKISLHTGVNAVLVTFVNIIYAWQYWWLLLLLPLVAWARVHDRHHTWAQAAAGALLGGGMTYLGMAVLL